MDEIATLLPPGVAIPVALILILPKILQAVRDLRASTRTLQLEKERLELMRIECEIEVLRKTHGLGPLKSAKLWVDDRSVRSHSSASEQPRLDTLPRFCYGALGAILPILVTLMISDLAIIFAEADFISILGLVLRVTALLFLGGFSAVLHPRATKIDCVMWGLAPAALLSLAVAEVAQLRVTNPADVM